MLVVCIICTELLSTDQDIVVTSCGHSFHHKCITNWFNTSKTCATCRQTSSTSSLIKVYFEKSDDSKVHDLHNDLISANSSLTKEMEVLTELQQTQQDKLRDATKEVSALNEKVKSLERIKQCDDMALAGFRAIKEESEKEIIKLKEQVNSLSLDLLAERQLRRIHQTTLHTFDSKNADYDTATILTDESLTKKQETLSSAAGGSGDGNGNKNYTITPFWKLSCEANAAKKDVSKDKPSTLLKPYVIPSKIQRASDSKPPTRLVPRYWTEPKLRSQCNRLSSFTLKDLSESKANASQSPQQLKHKLPSSSTSNFFTDTRDNNNTPSTSSFRFGSDQPQLQLVVNRLPIFKFGDASSVVKPGNSSSSSSASINFNFKTENSNAQDGFKMLNESSSNNVAGPSTSTQAQEPTTSSATAAASNSKKFTFGPKASDR